MFALSIPIILLLISPSNEAGSGMAKLKEALEGDGGIYGKLRGKLEKGIEEIGQRIGQLEGEEGKKLKEIGNGGILGKIIKKIEAQLEIMRIGLEEEMGGGEGGWTREEKVGMESLVEFWAKAEQNAMLLLEGGIRKLANEGIENLEVEMRKREGATVEERTKEKMEILRKISEKKKLGGKRGKAAIWWGKGKLHKNTWNKELDKLVVEGMEMRGGGEQKEIGDFWRMHFIKSANYATLALLDAIQNFEGEWGNLEEMRAKFWAASSKLEWLLGSIGKGTHIGRKIASELKSHFDEFGTQPIGIKYYFGILTGREFKEGNELDAEEWKVLVTMAAIFHIYYSQENKLEDKFKELTIKMEGEASTSSKGKEIAVDPEEFLDAQKIAQIVNSSPMMKEMSFFEYSMTFPKGFGSILQGVGFGLLDLSESVDLMIGLERKILNGLEAWKMEERGNGGILEDFEGQIRGEMGELVGEINWVKERIGGMMPEMVEEMQEEFEVDLELLMRGFDHENDISLPNMAFELMKLKNYLIKIKIQKKLTDKKRRFTQKFRELEENMGKRKKELRRKIDLMREMERKLEKIELKIGLMDDFLRKIWKFWLNTKPQNDELIAAMWRRTREILKLFDEEEAKGKMLAKQRALCSAALFLHIGLQKWYKKKNEENAEKIGEQFIGMKKILNEIGIEEIGKEKVDEMLKMNSQESVFEELAKRKFDEKKHEIVQETKLLWAIVRLLGFYFDAASSR